jgi:hypothetical protein
MGGVLQRDDTRTVTNRQYYFVLKAFARWSSRRGVWKSRVRVCIRERERERERGRLQASFVSRGASLGFVSTSFTLCSDNLPPDLHQYWIVATDCTTAVSVPPRELAVFTTQTSAAFTHRLQGDSAVTYTCLLGSFHNNNNNSNNKNIGKFISSSV